MHGPSASTSPCPHPTGLQSSGPDIGSPTDNGEPRMKGALNSKEQQCGVRRREQNLPGAIIFAVSCYRKNGHVRCVCKENYAGPNCERCAPGYYGNPLLIGSTCKKCDCSGNSDPNLIFEDCDEVTGQCRNCLHHTTGFKCERCAPGYFGDAIFAKNCTGCDKCIWDLTDDIRLAVLAIDESKSTLLSISTGVAAQNRLNDLNLTTTHLQVAMSKKKDHSTLWTIQVDDAADDMNDLLREAENLYDQGNQASSKGLLVQKETMETNNRATQLVQKLSNMRDNIQEVSSKMKYYAIQQELSPEEIAQKLSVAEEMLKEIKRRKPFTNERQLADEEENAAEDLLHQVEEFHERYNDTRSLVSDVVEQLNEHNVKLSDLEEALGQALDNVIQTEAANKENIANLQEHEKQHEKLKEQADEVNSILLSATAILAEPQKISSELSEVIKNVSGFYAEIDGARKELQEKIANLSLFDDELEEKAMQHAHNLRRLADELDRNLHGVDTNGLVQRAINASNVYENIAGYIEEANNAALLALNTTNRVNDAAVGIDTQIIYHRGNDLTIADTSRHVNGTVARMHAVQSKLMRAITKLQSAELGLEARQRLEKAKQKTAEAVSTTVTVTEATTPMDENVRLWSQNLQDFQHNSAAYDSAVYSAGDAVKKLTEVFPELLDKLRKVEQKAPANNISSSIQRIRDLIAQTRSVASKVQVSMMFGGQSAVEVNPKINVEELKSFTSMSLYIKLQKDNPQLAASPDRFILYLGNKNVKNYMGLAIKNDNLVYIYNLGDQDVEIPLDSKPVSTWPSYFSIIKIERIGRHGKMFLTVPSLSSTSEEKFIKTGETLGPSSLLNLEPENTVFYVGGAPPDFKLPPSLDLPGFIGCLELATLNDDVISLYNFKHAYNIDTTTSPPCARNKLAFTQSRAVSYFFDGSGYAVARNIERRGRFSQVTRFDIEVRTPTDNGLILLMVNGSMFFSLEMHNGFLYLRYDFGFSTGPVLLEDSMKKAQINDAKFHESDVLSISMDRGAVVLNASGIKIQSPDRNYNDGKTHFIITSVTPER
ncbi:UNVERIFIED_CONTAM: hypothetical protein H355_006187 [Colinus virginianus]|nr:hypothetical protein H355_006187 [Colinus virginianus]